MTYNHATYITDAMEGFVMQKTDFPYVAVIVDDASTDGNQGVIKEFFEKHFNTEADDAWAKEDDYAKYFFARHKENNNCYFAIQFLKENHYGKPIKVEHIKEWENNSKYIALCEGDDYWTDPQKLAKQHSAMERYQGLSLCCSGCKVKTGETIVNQRRYPDECIVPTEDIVFGGGLWLHTVTYFFRNGLLDVYPDCCKRCHVGDYPLILWASLNGGVYFLSDVTSVYRFQNKGSWTGRRAQLEIDEQIRGWQSEVNMLKGLNCWSNGFYSEAFNRRIGNYIFDEILNHKKDVNRIVNAFQEESKFFTRKQKLHVQFIRMHLEAIFLLVLHVWRSIKKRFH